MDGRTLIDGKGIVNLWVRRLGVDDPTRLKTASCRQNTEDSASNNEPGRIDAIADEQERRYHGDDDGEWTDERCPAEDEVGAWRRTQIAEAVDGQRSMAGLGRGRRHFIDPE